MAFSFVNFGNMNMYGYGAMPMIPPMPVFASIPMGHYHHHCCSPVNNFMSMYTTMALFNSFLDNTVSLFSTKDRVTTQSSNNYNPFSTFNFTIPSFDVYTPMTYIPPMPVFTPTVSTITTNVKRPKKTTSRNVTVRKPNTTTSLSDVAKIYDPEKGKKLAQATINGLQTANTGYCARAVKTAIANTGLGAYESGHASDMPEILSKNKKNFKEVNVAASDLNKLPAGCVLCYQPSDCGYNSTYGHTEVTDGNGNAYHFAKTNNIRQSDNVRVFVPV